MLSLSRPRGEPLSTWSFHTLYSSNGEQRRNLENQQNLTSPWLRPLRHSNRVNWSLLDLKEVLVNLYEVSRGPGLDEVSRGTGLDEVSRGPGLDEVSRGQGLP